MDTDREERVRRRAHEIWERKGQPIGHDREHWERAGREIDHEDMGAAARSVSETEDNPSGEDDVRKDNESPDSPRVEGHPGLGGYGSVDGEGSTEHIGPEGRPGLGGYGE